MIHTDKDKHTEEHSYVPIERLSAYIQAVDRLRGYERFSIRDLLDDLEDVTKQQLRSDLQSLGFNDTSQISRLQLAHALRRKLNQDRKTYQTVIPALSEFGPLASFLKNIKNHSDEEFSRRAPVIEAAYDYASQCPELFLLGHGLFASSGSSTTREPVVGFRHQVEEARRIIEDKLGNTMVVHQVGLGKTITAILVLAELLCRDPDLTALILIPTNLKDQWKKELTRCLDFPVYTGVNPEEIAIAPVILMSIDTAKEPSRAALLLQRQWGLLLVDEGHLLREEATARYQFVYALHAHHRLLLTATPVHNSPYDIYHQANIVRPGILGRKEVFAESHIISERQLANSLVLQERLAPIVNHCQRDSTGLPFPKRDIEEVSIIQRSQIERQLYSDVLNILRGIYRRHLGSSAPIRLPSGREQQVAQIVLVAILVLRELASHPLAAIHTLTGALLKQVRELARLTGDTTDLNTLEKIISRYAKETWEVGSHQKTDTLLAKLPELVNTHGRVIVYVEFRETQKIIINRLMNRREAGLSPQTEIISFYGGLSPDEKIHQIERFEKHPLACFISTDAGGQGLNLQAGHVVLNFDFPWNPMRVEQRIGRVDRLGQPADTVVVVRNFITVDTIEQYVYQTLRQKFKVCEDVLGKVLPLIFTVRQRAPRFASESDVLGIGHLILSSRDDEDLRQKFLAFDQTIDEQIKAQTETWRQRRRWLNE